MHRLGWIIALFSVLAAQALSAPNCPIYGAEFPKPPQLAENPIWKAAMQNLSTVFDGVEADAKNYSFSVQIFSTNPGPPILFERFHTAQNLPSNTTGVKKVDAHTVYRIGSVTKIFTALAFLAEAGDKYFSHPITDFVPELAAINAKRANAPVDELRTVDWEDINIQSLLSQMSGIERDYLILGEIVGAINLTDVVNLGFPPLAPEQIPECGGRSLCNRTQFFAGLENTYPSYAPWKTPAYSNIAFQLLSYALENITGRSFISSLNQTVLRPLDLRDTYYYTANETVGIIPRAVNDTKWNVYIGDESPSGNMFASAGDLSKLGIAVLNSSLIKPVLTRRWLKPVSFTADHVAAVGMPWGLRRLQLSDSNPHRTVTAFTKAGGVGDYSSILSIIPEFDVGITVMIAGPDTAGIVWSVADYLGQVLLPTLDAVTKDDANARFGGTYRWIGTKNFTSSLTLATDPDKPGLGASAWVSNNTDMIPVALSLQSGLSVASDPASNSTKQPSVRLYYTGLDSVAANGNKLQSFKAVFESTGGAANPGRGFSTDCGVWIDYTGVTYAGMPLDEFIFELDGDSKVLSVTNLALNSTLKKVK
ncbi:uncharacterized protein JN550_000802 [Neoarthrinium moseri]|uniref:uncharacterized protein n=1 Tax=Neoarthrinium moseri TaxID=1658444 RepID=UPI001FDD19DC|nr:uncharacterized protein JN550_000802 [Neoarthrinium moseri]KAI1876730.1 hypothetical protein JN550_000802 [Neoarthrinium moseri]